MLKIISSVIYCIVMGCYLFLLVVGIIEVIKMELKPVQYSTKPTTKTDPQRDIDEMDAALAENMRRREQEQQFQFQQREQMQQDMFWNQF